MESKVTMSVIAPFRNAVAVLLMSAATAAVADEPTADLDAATKEHSRQELRLHPSTHKTGTISVVTLTVEFMTRPHPD